MPEAYQQFDFGVYGEPIPALTSPYAWITQGFIPLASGEVVGDGVANGTAILTIAVPAGRILVVAEGIIQTLANPTLINFVNSNVNGVGGVEVLLSQLDIVPNAPLLIGFGYPKGAPIMINNKAGTATRYLVIYAPQSRAGVATNNANTEFWVSSLLYKLT